MGATYVDTAGVHGGRAFVYSGADASLLFLYAGEGPSDYFATSVTGVGDLNGDGFPEIVVGAASNVGPGSASVFAGGHTQPSNIDSDGVVGVIDLLLLLSEWGASGSSNADLSGDGVVDRCDLAILLFNWG